MKKFKVLLCSPLGDIAEGGVYKWTHNILEYYKENNRTNIELFHLYTKGVTILATTNIVKRIYHGIFDSLNLIRLVNNKLKYNYYDVIHTSTSGSLGLLRDYLLLHLCKRKRVKRVVHFHFGRIPDIFSKRNWEYKILKGILDISDMGIVMDLTSYDILKNNGFENIVFIPNPYPVEIDNMILKENNIVRIPKKVVFAGHIVPSKGIFELVDACNKGQYDLTLIGTIPDENVVDLLYKVANENKHMLHIVGKKPFDYVVRQMLAAEIFTLPSYTEGFPNVILEAMACRCPIVATKVGAIPQMLNIDGEDICGICVNPKDSESLLQAMKYLSYNPEIAQNMGDNARARVEQEYSSSNVWHQLTSCWQSVL